MKGQACIPTTYYHKIYPTLASALCIGCEPSVLTVTSRQDGDQEAGLRRQRKLCGSQVVSWWKWCWA